MDIKKQNDESIKDINFLRNKITNIKDRKINYY